MPIVRATPPYSLLLMYNANFNSYRLDHIHTCTLKSFAFIIMRSTILIEQNEETGGVYYLILVDLNKATSAKNKCYWSSRHLMQTLMCVGTSSVARQIRLAANPRDCAETCQLLLLSSTRTSARRQDRISLLSGSTS